jgi:glyoxylase I family protein
MPVTENSNMKISFIDHIIVIAKSIKDTEKFYTNFLGSPIYRTEETVVYQVGNTRVFFVLPEGGFEETDKDKSGLNHIAFGVRTLQELQLFEQVLNAAFIRHSGIKIDKYGNKEFIWFDDPSGTRVELYCRPLQ